MGLIKAAFDPPNRGSWGNAAGEFCPPEGRICFVPICCLSCLMFGGLYHADVTLLMLQLFWWLFSMEAIRSFHLHQWQHSRFSPLISVLRSLYSIRIFLLLHSFHEDFLLNTCSSTPDFRRNGVTDFFYLCQCCLHGTLRSPNWTEVVKSKQLWVQQVYQKVCHPKHPALSFSSEMCSAAKGIWCYISHMWG